MKNFKLNFRPVDNPGLVISVIPVAVLIAGLIAVIGFNGADMVQDSAPWLLLGAGGASLLFTLLFTRRKIRLMRMGIIKSALQILPAIPLLLCIAMLSTTWMISGVVPLMIHYGLQVLDPSLFLAITCVVCAAVSVVTGSSWTTIATIGVAFIGIGSVMGYNEAWVAGAIISGAYFGDKVSPLSDTTVLAASSCGIDLFRHIRFLMYTTVPAMFLAIMVFLTVGFFTPVRESTDASEMLLAIEHTFNLTPWLLVIPAITLLLIAFRVQSLVTLAVGAFTGLAGIFIFQPAVADSLGARGDELIFVLRTLATGADISSGTPSLDALISTSGVKGILPTVLLVLCAMIFGGVMIGTGMLSTLTRSFTQMLHKPRSLVGATVVSGLFLNGCTGDQYLSIIIGGNIYRSTYRRRGLADEMLSRSLEDSISVTSVLIPWNSCGLTQSSVLGVATLTYLPCCIFNLLSPVLSVLYAWIGFKIRHRESDSIETVRPPVAITA